MMRFASGPSACNDFLRDLPRQLKVRYYFLHRAPFQRKNRVLIERFAEFRKEQPSEPFEVLHSTTTTVCICIFLQNSCYDFWFGLSLSILFVDLKGMH
jgi:hypothetical protein